MSDAIKTFKATQKQIENLKKEWVKQGKEAFKDGIKSVFDAHPKMKSVKWRQYTPYFNDGEPCTFRACTDDPEINDNDYYTDEDGTGMTREEFDAAHKEVTSYLALFNDEILESLFGDHCQVEVTRKGIKVSEYSHD